MERDAIWKPSSSSAIYFNSHAHVERDSFARAVLLDVPISTHTLTWSVTRRVMCNGIRICISTHTLTWSVTLSLKSFALSMRISTHTLTWSVTPRRSARVNIPLHFNSHAHVERDVIDVSLLPVRYISTHTLTWSVTSITHDTL